MEKSYKILQINNSKGLEIPRFFGYEDVKDDGFCEDWYREVYEGKLTAASGASDVAILEELFRIFNVDRPKDFTGHSLSISDIVILEGLAYYCDDFGWTAIPGFEWKSVICL